MAAAVAFALVIQGFYHPQPLFEKARFVDELIGGVLGVVQAGIILGAVIVILDSLLPIPDASPRDHGAAVPARLLDVPRRIAIVDFFRTTLIPGFFVVFGFLVPDEIEARLPEAADDVLDALRPRRSGDARGRAGRSSGARLVRDDDDGPARRPHRRGRGVHRRGRPGVARPVRADALATRSCSGRRASPTCTLSTGCTTA